MSIQSPNFDYIAAPYRRLEYLTLGRTLEHARFHYLPNRRARNERSRPR